MAKIIFEFYYFLISIYFLLIELKGSKLGKLIIIDEGDYKQYV